MKIQVWVHVIDNLNSRGRGVESLFQGRREYMPVGLTAASLRPTPFKSDSTPLPLTLLSRSRTRKWSGRVGNNCQIQAKRAVVLPQTLRQKSYLVIDQVINDRFLSDGNL